VALETALGRIVIELDAERAPRTVRNFLAHVNGRFYDGLIFHRVISGFVIQAGLLTEQLQSRLSGAPLLELEATGLRNVRGSVAMARASDPHSAQAEFFINVRDNQRLDPSDADWGYAVFGRVVEGMNIVDRINGAQTRELGDRRDVPVEPVAILSSYLAARDSTGWTELAGEATNPWSCFRPSHVPRSSTSRGAAAGMLASATISG
jgi:cyclophilin family peptidyl-prolyl cis-trans isomerase